MAYDLRCPNASDKPTGEIVRDLRAFASAGIDSVYAIKLLAVAAELETIGANQNAIALAKTE